MLMTIFRGKKLVLICIKPNMVLSNWVGGGGGGGGECVQKLKLLRMASFGIFEVRCNVKN